MIILRNRFYYVSTLPGLETKIMKPSVPDNFLTREKLIDNKTKRIRLYKTIEDAISGIYLGETFKKGTKLYVYRALGIHKDFLFGPMKIFEVPYALVLDEYWYKESLRFEKVFEIEVEKKGESTYKYGPRQRLGKIYRWSWKEVKPWKQKNYSIISDIKHSGIKRTYKKQAGRIRRKVSKKLEDSIIQDKNNYENTISEIKNRHSIIPFSKEIEKKTNKRST